MIDLALDSSETRATRPPEARTGATPRLRIVLLSLAGAGALGGFGIAASTVMSGLAAPAPVKFVSSGRAADWPELKDGRPALAVAGQPAAAPVRTDAPAEPAAPSPRMASLPEAFTPAPAPAKAAAPVKAAVQMSPAAQVSPAAQISPAAQATAVPVPPARRIPVPTPVVPVAAARQVVPLPPARMAALQPPRASETVRAREVAEPAAAPKPIAAPSHSEKTEKPARKTVAVQKAPAAVKTAEKPRSVTATAVAQAEAAPEETEVLGIKIPSLAPAGRKLKESVDALGEAVKSVF